MSRKTWDTARALCLAAIVAAVATLSYAAPPKKATAKPTPQPTSVPTPAPDPVRKEAIEALRAVDVIFENGGSAEDIKKYQLESAVKVDRLSAAPENESLRTAARRYKDASRLFELGNTGLMMGDEKAAFLEGYAGEEKVAEALKKVDTTVIDKKIAALTEAGPATRRLAEQEAELAQSLNKFYGFTAAKELMLSTRPMVRSLN